MKQPVITNTEQAREFYINEVRPCPRGCDLYDAFTPETLKAYEEHSSEELERQWRLEEFERYFSQIGAGKGYDPGLLKRAWEWYDDDTPVKYTAEKLEILFNECGGKPDKLLTDCIFTAACYSEIDKNDEDSERALARLMELCTPFVSVEDADRLRLKISGPNSEDDAKRQYRMNWFSDKADGFQTHIAERNFKRFATPENMLIWKQEYFDEWTDKAYHIETVSGVDLVSLAAPHYGIYGRENLEKLYVKLSDYKSCADFDCFRSLSYDIVMKLSEPLYSDGEFELLERFYALALDMMDDAPDCPEKVNLGNIALDKIEHYHALMEEKRNG